MNSRKRRNPVARHAGKYNVAKTHTDRKKAQKQGYEKHKGRSIGRPLHLWVAFILLFQALAFPAYSETRPVAVITGSSYGLGKQLALRAADEGMRLVLVDMRPAPSLQLLETLKQRQVPAIFIEADLAIARQRAAIIHQALETYGRIDYLFNNAGYSYLATLEQMDLVDAHHLFEVNYWAYAHLAQQAIPIMRQQGSGVIVNVASILGVRPSPPGLGHYGASKHALLGLFQAVAREVADDGIRVIVAAPAGMKTRISKHSTGPLANPDVDRAANWEDPAVVAKDIFTQLKNPDGEVVIFPGYIGRQ